MLKINNYNLVFYAYILNIIVDKKEKKKKKKKKNNLKSIDSMMWEA